MVIFGLASNFFSSFLPFELHGFEYIAFILNLVFVSAYSTVAVVNFMKDPDEKTYATATLLPAIFIFLSLGTPNRFVFSDSISQISILFLVILAAVISYQCLFFKQVRSMLFFFKTVPIGIVCASVVIFMSVSISVSFGIDVTVEKNININEKKMGYSVLPTYKIILEDDKIREVYVSSNQFQNAEKDKTLRIILKKGFFDIMWIKSLAVVAK